MSELGVGMIGYGFMGKVHTLAYRSIPIMYDPQPLKVRLVGVATAHEEKRWKRGMNSGRMIGVKSCITMMST
jgi:predicted dehydrogenase